ncbi:lipid droplet-associated hydrolase-like isoform X3 [Amblyomma americanum]
MEKGGATPPQPDSNSDDSAAQQQQERDVPMHFVSVNKVPTQVICFGDQCSSLVATDDARPVVLVIPDHPTLYSCEGQVGHKLSFIKQYIPSEAPLILVGHSIGCHMVLEILKRAPDLNVQKAVLLFPAIESLDACPRVSIISPLVTYLRPLTVATLSALRLLPRVVQNLLIRLYIFLATACTTPHRSSLRGAVNYFRPECLMACFVFTRDIIQNVRERDNETIARHADKLTVYYGQNDHWSPVEYYDDMRRTFPEADVRLCERGFRHAFVLDRSADVGCMVREWIETLLS